MYGACDQDEGLAMGRWVEQFQKSVKPVLWQRKIGGEIVGGPLVFGFGNVYRSSGLADLNSKSSICG